MGSAGGDGNDSVNPIHVDLVVRDGVARARKSRGASRLYEMSSEPGLRAEASPESDNNAHVGQVEEAKDDELREADETNQTPADNGADDPGAEELNKETVELKAAYKALNLKQLRANLDVAIREQEALEKTNLTETDVKRAKSVLVDTADDFHHCVKEVKRGARAAGY